MLNYFVSGGFMMWLLLVVSVIVVAIITERFWSYFHARVDETQVMSRIKNMVQGGAIAEVLAYVSKQPGPVCGVLKEGLAAWPRGQQMVQDACERAAVTESARLERYLPILGALASISTLLGFTGTVLGMINAFNSIAQAGASSPAIVAGGIAQALITTATGLLIAIPTLIFYHYFNHLVDRFSAGMERYARELVDLMGS